MTQRPTFVLASASPRRLDLLRQIGLQPDKIVAPEIDETPGRDETPIRYASRMAIAKAEAIELVGAAILSADTVVAVGRRILPKAGDGEAVKACLGLLSGRAHLVITALALKRPDGRMSHRCVRTRVAFKALSAREVDAYAQSREGEGKAGGYAIQGAAGRFVRAINGSYSGIVGLPLAEAADVLESVGVFPP